ncbi:MAG: serine/threonine-protein kinase [Pseudomonadota bacterium]
MSHPIPILSSGEIGRYQLGDKAGEGASGIVYRAYDPLLDRDVAIKLARTEKLDANELAAVIAEFRHEGKIAGKFAHENIATIYDVVSEGALNYLVMEYIPGRSLDDYMKATGPLDLDEALIITYKCCVGLAYIHYNGVIHRDIKPGNVMYHPAHGITKLMDFSIAHKIEEPPPRDTGTIAYMAPEHFDHGRRISYLTDIFALGSSLYRLLTGEYPFSRDHTAFQILHEDPKPMSDFRGDIPEQVASLVNRAMAKSDDARFQSAGDFAYEVERVANTLFPGANIIDTTAQYMKQ